MNRRNISFTLSESEPCLRTCSQPYPLVDIHKIKDLSSCFVKQTRRFPICGSLYLNTVPKVVRSRAKRSAQRVCWFSVLNLLLTP